MMNDAISRHGVAAWLDNMGYSKLADAVMDENRFPPAQPEQRKGRWRMGVCECGYDWAKDAPISSVPNFCPQCGADMREK